MQLTLLSVAEFVPPVAERARECGGRDAALGPGCSGRVAALLGISLARHSPRVVSMPVRCSSTCWMHRQTNEHLACSACCSLLAAPASAGVGRWSVNVETKGLLVSASEYNGPLKGQLC